jgi:hypothetical protein
MMSRRVQPRREPASDGDGLGVLALARDDGDDGVDLDALGPAGDEDPGKDALVDCLDFHRRLVGLDLAQHLAGLDRIALGFEPARDLAFGHGRRQSGHQNIGWHRRAPSRACQFL